MITKSNIRTLLELLGFSQNGNVYIKRYEDIGATLKVDVASEHIFYKESGITVGRETTSNFSEPENFVVLECVDRLLDIEQNTLNLSHNGNLDIAARAAMRTFGYVLLAMAE